MDENQNFPLILPNKDLRRGGGVSGASHMEGDSSVKSRGGRLSGGGGGGREWKFSRDSEMRVRGEIIGEVSKVPGRGKRGRESMGREGGEGGESCST